MQSQGGGDTWEWRAVCLKYIQQQKEWCNYGIFVIADALAVAMAQDNSRHFDPEQWRIWLERKAAPLRALSGSRLHW